MTGSRSRSLLPGASLPLALAILVAILTFVALTPTPATAQTTVPSINIAIVCHGDATNASDFFAAPLSYNATIGIQAYVRGVAMWTDLMNSGGGIPTHDANNTMVMVKTTYFNIGNTTQSYRGAALADRLVNGTYGNYSIIIAPPFSLDSQVETFMLACERTNSCLTIAPMTSSSPVYVCTSPMPSDCATKSVGQRRFQYGFSVLYDSTYTLDAHLSLFAQQQLPNIAVVYSSQTYGQLAAQATAAKAGTLGLTVVSTIMLPLSNSTNSSQWEQPWSVATASQYVQQWKAQGIDAICILSNGADTVALTSLVNLWTAFKQVNWLPGAIAIGGSISTTLQTAVGNTNYGYVLTSAQWDWRLKGAVYNATNTSSNFELFPSTPAKSSPAVFRDTMISYWGAQITDTSLVYALDGAQALTFVQKFIETGKAYDVESMRNASRTVSVASIAGQLTLDGYGRTVVTPGVVYQQLINGSRVIASPSTIALDFVSPMPPFDQRANTTMPSINIAVICHGDPNKLGDFFYRPLNYTTLSLQIFNRGAEMWSRMINSMGGIPTYDANNTMVQVHLTFFNIGNTSQTYRATQLSNRLVTGIYGNYSVVIAPGFSLDPIVTIFMLACERTKSCLSIAPLTPSSAVFVCTSPLPSDCNRAGNRRFQYGFSVLYDGNYALSAHLSLFRQQQMRNIAVVFSSQPYGLLAAQATEDTAFGLGLNTASAVMLPLSNSTNSSQWEQPWSVATASQYVQQWKAQGIDAICILSNGADTVALTSLVNLWTAFKQVNWLPGAIAIGGSISTTLQTAVGNTNYGYVLTSAQWDWHLKGRAYSTVGTAFNLELFPATPTHASPSVFRDTMISYWGAQITDTNLVYAADAVQALTFVQKFIESGYAYDVESMRTASRAVSVASITGQLQLDADGRTVVSDALVFQQLVDGSRLIISPLSIGVNPILPMPTWDQRAFDGEWFADSVEQAALALNTILLVYTSLIVAGFIIYRKHSVMKAATPLFCVLMTLGGMLMQLSIYGTGLYVNTSGCIAQFWFLTTGFSLMFGALFMKTYRVWRIFNAGKKLRQVAISNTLLLAWLAGLMSFDIILNIIASGMNLFESELVTVDEYRPSLNYQQCVASGGSRVYLLMTAVEKAALIFAGIVLTIATRNVPSKFNETPYLATAIYNCGLLCAFAVAIVASGIGGRMVSYAIQVFGIEVLVFSTLSIVFVPKFYLIFGDTKRLKELEKLNADNTGTGESNAHNSKPTGATPVGTGGQWNKGSAAGAAGRVHPNPMNKGANSSLTPGQADRHSGNANTTQMNSAQMTSLHRPSFVGPVVATNGRGSIGTRTNGNFAVSGTDSASVPSLAHARQDVIVPFSANNSGTNDTSRETNSDDSDDLVIPANASTALLVSQSIRLTTKIESLSAALTKIQYEVEKRRMKGEPTLSGVNVSGGDGGGGGAMPGTLMSNSAENSLSDVL